MNTRDHIHKAPRSIDLPEEVKTELIRRRDAVEAGEPTIDRDKTFEELQRRASERNNPSRVDQHRIHAESSGGA